MIMWRNFVLHQNTVCVRDKVVGPDSAPKKFRLRNTCIPKTVSLLQGPNRCDALALRPALGKIISADQFIFAILNNLYAFTVSPVYSTVQHNKT